MKNIWKYGIPAMAMMFSVYLFSSCEDWTDTESLTLRNPSFEEQNPQLYADYIKDLKKYKEGEHKLLFVSFENPVENPSKQAERLTAIPDSVDFVCLNNPEISAEVQAEMIKVREKGTRTLYSIDYDSFEADWKEKVKANPELTEEDALSYLAECTDAMTAYCDKYGYDGIVIDYIGRSLVGMVEDVLNQYKGRQQNFFNKVLDWQNKHAGKTLVFYGNVQYLAPEAIGMLDKYDYIILRTAASSNEDELTLSAYMAVQYGMDVAAGNDNWVNPVPTDRFIVCARFPEKDDKDKVIGYWNTLNEKGEKTLSVPGSAQWTMKASPDYTRSGLFIMDIQKDYYNNTYGSVREAIHIMNPNK